MSNKRTYNILNKTGREIVNQMDSWLANNHDVTKGSVRFSIETDTEGNLDLSLDAADFVHFLDTGRRPGKQPPLSKIQAWTQKKGIDKKAAFPIARSIGINGIPAGNFWDEIIERVLRQYQPYIEQAIEDDAFDEINKKFK